MFKLMTSKILSRNKQLFISHVINTFSVNTNLNKDAYDIYINIKPIGYHHYYNLYIVYIHQLNTVIYIL